MNGRCRKSVSGAARPPTRGRARRHGGASPIAPGGQRCSTHRAHSRKQIAELIGVAPETISVWKRHPQWQRELDRWRELAETPLDATQMRLKLESLEAMTTALEQLQLLMGATKPVSRGGTVSDQPDWQTRLKACRLVLAITFAVIPEFQDQHRQTPVDHRTLRIDR
jgi:hypothetical protein